MKVRRAVISVSDKTGIVELAKGLNSLKVEILSTGGTAKAIRDAGINVIDIAEYTGSPEILDGRLKTLHPMVHGGILGLRSSDKHQKEMSENNIKPIDMIVVNLYPFESTIAKPDCSFEDAIENIDIGGPTMLRAAAKNWQDVAVVTDPFDYEEVLMELLDTDGELKRETTFKLAQKVFATTARYDSAICNYLNAYTAPTGEKQDFPKSIGLPYQKVQDLRYGENPHQKAAFYKEYDVGEPCVANIEQLHGKELSYNNIMDTDAAIELVKEFSDQTAVVILKHTNPCGAATSSTSLVDAFTKAKATDPISAFGGIIGLSQVVDEATASSIAETFFEVIVAPDYDPQALAVLQKKKNIRLIKLPGLTESYVPKGWSTRKVVGGLLVQDRDLGCVDITTCDVPTKRKPTDEEYQGLAFAWKICKHVKSNAIVYASNDQLRGVGAGQMSRLDSARFAQVKMSEISNQNTETPEHQNTRTPEHQGLLVCASDAFFPFRDGIDEAAKAGATAIIQPGGSKRDSETVEAANEHDIAMVFTGMRHFKH